MSKSVEGTSVITGPKCNKGPIRNNILNPSVIKVPSVITRLGGGGKRRGLGPRNDVLTTCKAVTPRGGQRKIAVLFPQ